ncbi:MAG: SsrA-binding protein SmpB [Firmicutes bacterium]|nr:SsrA-binding protein SmpB [Bacillota bacterium]
MKIVADNKKARFEYFVLDSVEAGLALKGFEVKSIRLGQVSLGESFCQLYNGEMWLKNCHITPYKMETIVKIDPLRDRKLLMHKNEINKLGGKAREKGYTLVPLKMYFKNGRVKLEVGLCQGKQLHDKRDTIKERDIKRLAEREIARY